MSLLVGQPSGVTQSYPSYPEPQKSCVLSPQPMSPTTAVYDCQQQGLSLPEEKNFRISTLNHQGYMFTRFDPLVEHLLDVIEKKAAMTIFEVGGAYGNVAVAALEKGASQYYLNDCEEQHLQLCAQALQTRGKGQFFQSLHLIPGRCPENVQLLANSVDVIMVNKVLHFFTPETIDAFIRWIYAGLKEGGHAYILTISPHYRGHESLLSEYEKSKNEGKRFPGYVSNYAETEPGKKYDPRACPKSLLFMELDSLKALFHLHGFCIEQEYALSTLGEKDTAWGPGREMVGLIARKIRGG